MLSKVKKIITKNKSWLLSAVLIPFIVTKILLLLIAWFSQYFMPSQTYFPINEAKKTIYSNIRYIDVFGRFDTGWYLSVIEKGYKIDDPTYSQYNNIAFFPFFPSTVKLISFLLPHTILSTQTYFIIGLIISNIATLISLILLYQISMHVFNKERVAQLTNWLLLLAPGGFFLSTFYSEPLFLCLLLATYYSLQKKNWFLFTLFGSMLSITRMIGVLITLPIFFEQIKLIKSDIKSWPNGIISLVIIPIPVFLFFTYSQMKFGDFFAPTKSHMAWSRNTTFPWDSLLNPTQFIGYITPLEKYMVIFLFVTLLLGIKILPKLRYYCYYSILVLLIPLFTGTTTSMIRFSSILFPVYMTLAYYSEKSDTFKMAIQLIFITFQVLLFAAWCQFYWVG